MAWESSVSGCRVAVRLALPDGRTADVDLRFGGGLTELLGAAARFLEHGDPETGANPAEERRGREINELWNTRCGFGCAPNPQADDPVVMDPKEQT